MRVLRYLLPICLFFAIEYAHALTEKTPTITSYISAKNAISSTTSELNIYQYPGILIQNSLFSENDDDDDFATDKKKILLSRYFSAQTYIPFIRDCSNSLKKSLLSCKGFNYPSAVKYIFQQVIKV